MNKKYLFLIVSIFIISLLSAAVYQEPFNANVEVSNPYNLTATSVIAVEDVYIGTGTEWLNIYSNGLNGFFNSTYPIISTNELVMGSSSVPKNITMFSPDGTKFTCNVNNSGSFLCN